MAELHITDQYLRPGIYISIVIQSVGVQEMNPALFLCPYHPRKEGGHNKDQYEEILSQRKTVMQ